MNSQLLRVLSNKSFLFLWLAEVFSQIAMNMVNFVLIIVVYEIAHSNTAVSGIVLSYTIPAIFFGMIAGVYVDRFNKKKILLATNVLRALLLFILAIFHSNLLVIYVISFLVAILTQFFIPAETPMIPILVDQKKLLPANALFGMGIYASIVLAYAISGPLLLFFGSTSAFLVLTALFLIASVFVSLIKLPKGEVKPTDSILREYSFNFLHEMKEIYAALSKTRQVYQSLLLLTLSQVLILIIAVVGPGFANQVLGITVDAFPLLFITPAAVGMVFGAVLVGNYLNTFSKQKLATFGVFGAGASMLLLPYGSKVASQGFILAINSVLPHAISLNILHIMIVLAFLLGFSTALVFVPSNTILQEETSEGQRGRIYGAMNSLIGVFSLVPIILVGGLADLVGVGKVITGIGVVLVGIGILRIRFK